MTQPMKRGLTTAIVGALMVPFAVWGVQQYQERFERETLAPQRLQVRLMAVHAGDAALQRQDLDEAVLRVQQQARIRQLLAQDLSLTAHPYPDQALTLLTPGAVSLVADEAGLLAALTRQLLALPKTDWQRTVIAPDHWQVVVDDTCLSLRNHNTAEADWRWTSIGHCDAD